MYRDLKMEEVRQIISQVKLDIENRNRAQLEWHAKLETLLLAKILADRDSFAKQLSINGYRTWFPAADLIEAKEFDWRLKYGTSDLSEKLSKNLGLTVKIGIGEYPSNLSYTDNASDRVGCLIKLEN